MAVYVKSNFLLVPLVVLSLLVASSYGRFTTKISEGDVNTICRKVKDHSFCFNFFKSTRQAKTSNLPGVEKLLIRTASRKALDMQKQFQSLFKSAGSPVSKAIYDECSELYGNSSSDFDDALEALEAKDSAGLNTHVSAALTNADTCESEFSDVKISPQLLKKISVIDNLTEIALVISNMLPRN